MGRCHVANRVTATEPSDLTKARFRVSDPDHPHFGETGRLTGECIRLFGKPMAKLQLENCQHGTDACFVGNDQLTVERRRRI